MKKGKAKPRNEKMTARIRAYKMVQPNGIAYYDKRTLYEVGKTVEILDPDPPSTGACGRGLHVCKDKYGPIRYVKWPWRMLEVSYLADDVIATDGEKTRVKKLKVERELKATDIGLPNARRFFKMVERAVKIKMRVLTEADRKKVERLVGEHISRLEYSDTQHHKIPFKGVQFYTIEEWGSVSDSVWGSVRDSVSDSVSDSVRDSVWDSVRDSVWDSVWDSVRGSVRDSVRDSVWDSVRGSVWGSVWDSVWGSVRDSVWDSDKDNPFLPMMQIAELGASFHGIDKNGIAHVIAPSADEVRP